MLIKQLTVADLCVFYLSSFLDLTISYYLTITHRMRIEKNLGNLKTLPLHFADKKTEVQ